MRQSPEKTSSGIRSFFESARTKIAIAALGLATVPGCHVCANFNLNSPEGRKEAAQEAARRKAVEADDNKIIHATEIDAIIIIERQKLKECRSKIQALLDISEYSPLHEKADHTRVYDLPAEASPWTKLVIEPDGQITMRIDGNAIALGFKCDENLGKSEDTYCKGAEVDPEKLSDVEEIHEYEGGSVKEDEADEKEDEAKKKEEAEAKKKEEEEAAAKKQRDAELEASAVTGSLADKAYIISDLLTKLTGQLETAIAKLDWPAKQELARELASVNPEWVAFVEKQISDINASKGKKSDLDGTIIHLLHFRPKMIEDVAKELRVTLQWPEPKAEPETESKPEAPQTEPDSAKKD
ncbi:hypothetical protein JXD20_00010 [Candidatus Peregrinibacteria bacterium]|nr:hypothetical protein [Candidatus Peregrinibacteria bacterium]